MVMLTDAAVQRLKKFLEQENCPDYGIRIFLSLGSG